MKSTTIRFLPSRYGHGGNLTITGHYGDMDADGWVAAAYQHLHGVAVRPDISELQSDDWRRTVVRRFEAQGVIFLERDEVQQYMNSEGVYWNTRGKGDGYESARHPTWMERLLWKFRPPSMPIDERLKMHAG